MEKFRTEVETRQSDFRLNYQNTILTLGSCFAENIGKAMHELYLNVEVNPFGLYNPISILKSIEILMNKKDFSERDIFEYRGIWNSFSHSSHFSDTNPLICLDKINSRLKTSVEFIEKANVLLLTFGTAWVYEEKQRGNVVSNCHKLPAATFHRRRLSVREIVESYSSLLDKFEKKYPQLKIIFSVSPVRHLKDTAHGNNLSKSVLLLAIEELCENFKNAVYFPAYEILLDDLRDYRFYAVDMVHPSEVAVQYIWQKFSETYFDEESLVYFKEVKQLNNDLNHRPFFPDSEEFGSFLKSLNAKKISLAFKYPYLKSKL